MPKNIKKCTVGEIIPPLIDEIEVFERLLSSILPKKWIMERMDNRRIDPLNFVGTQPYLSDWERFWILSTPWPGKEPQRVQIILFLVRDSNTLQGGKELLTEWERFSIVAQNPSQIQIDNQFFSWTNLPRWSNARNKIIKVFTV